MNGIQATASVPFVSYVGAALIGTILIAPVMQNSGIVEHELAAYALSGVLSTTGSALGLLCVHGRDLYQNISGEGVDAQ